MRGKVLGVLMMKISLAFFMVFIRTISCQLLAIEVANIFYEFEACKPDIKGLLSLHSASMKVSAGVYTFHVLLHSLSLYA